MADTVIIEESTPVETGYRFSWGIAIAGGVIGAATTFFLLALGAGFGLMLVNPYAADNPSVPAFLTGGAIYFVAANAFGFAVGGHIAGRLLGPVFETSGQEKFRAGAHGLAAWAVALLATVTMVALGGMAALHGGMTAAGLYGASAAQTGEDHASAIVVDRLFRPAAPTMPTTTAGPPNRIPNTAARDEAGRLIDATWMIGQNADAGDRERLIQLSATEAGLSHEEASGRVDAEQNAIVAEVKQTVDIARKTASYASLWMAAALLFGAIVAMAAAVYARIEDDRDEAKALRRGLA
jgi:hypothetical protein